MSRILIIDDEPNIRETISDLLELKGYEVLTAADGTIGLTKAIASKPDLIVCDVMMPEMGGWEVLQAIRAEKGIENTPFLFLTAKVEQEDRRKGMNLGADDYLSKPFHKDDLFQAVATRLNRSHQIQQEISEKVRELDSQLHYYAAHELNTPLNGILGSLELLKDYKNRMSSEEVDELLEILQYSGKRLKKTISNNLMYYVLRELEEKPQLKKPYIQGKTHKPHEVIKRTAEEIASNYQRKGALKIDVESVDEAPLMEDKLQKIIEEIMDNAFKFSYPNSQVSVKGTKTNEAYVVTICNQGREFKASDIQQIGPFRQFDRDIYEQQGSGLGLFVAQSLITLQNGTLEIESMPEGKTKVTLTFPLRNAS